MALTNSDLPQLVSDLSSMGVQITAEQIDYMLHPEGRMAVAIYGIPSIDLLYSGGYDVWATMYQRALPGTPCDSDGHQAVVLPAVMHGISFDEGVSTFTAFEGEPDEEWP